MFLNWNMYFMTVINIKKHSNNLQYAWISSGNRSDSAAYIWLPEAEPGGQELGAGARALLILGARQSAAGRERRPAALN